MAATILKARFHCLALTDAAHTAAHLEVALHVASLLGTPPLPTALLAFEFHYKPN